MVLISNHLHTLQRLMELRVIAVIMIEQEEKATLIKTRIYIHHP